MKRVMIVGGPGSGKSTLARVMGGVTGLPVHHMDHIHWMPGWQARPRVDRIELALAVERSPAWLFEGGFSTTYAHRAQRADTLVWLDLPVWLRLWRVTYRSARNYGQRRPDMAEGCVETIHKETIAFYRYIWATRQSHRRAIQAVIDSHPHLEVYHLTSRADVSAFLVNLTRHFGSYRLRPAGGNCAK